MRKDLEIVGGYFQTVLDEALAFSGGLKGSPKEHIVQCQTHS